MDHFIAHIINHTHWDREWFLTSVYTSRWIAGLIDRLADLVALNPEFHFFLDGQTLVIEDLYQLHPEYRAKVERLVRGGNLLIGPYYCQPDWRLTGAEALLRNFLFGWQDMQQHGAPTQAGWLVDTFGHISQAPQLHRLFGIDSVYIWRGAPKMEPFFHWRGADGTEIFTINLFGGYRNLYGVTHTPELASRRLQAEIDKLAPYYPRGDIPLFDGYDLEDNPEDPLKFYRDISLPPEIEIQEATPYSFARLIRQENLELPTLAGELNSGKYGAVFPGTLSARTYLKVMARDCEQLLYGLCEPLAVLARLQGRFYPAADYAAWSRLLLQNAVHDCICGVSIDQVHEKMEFTYRQVFDSMQADLQRSLDRILTGFAPGTYAISASPFPFEGWIAADGGLYRVRTSGVGVWKTGEWLPIHDRVRPVETFTWKNDHYEAQLRPDGTFQVGQAVLGALLVYEERGDAYSGETGPFLGVLETAGPTLVEQESQHHCLLRLNCSGSWKDIQLSAVLRVTFDTSPLIRWQVELDGRGTDYRIEIVFETAQPGQVQAGMPFDVTLRPAVDRDLLPRELGGNLPAVLLGQRELGEVRNFPFQDFIAMSDVSRSAVVFAKGLHAYQASEDGQISIPLNRVVEWLTRPNLEGRVGDAGPFFYIPDGRGERTVTHELAFASINSAADSLQLQALNAAFQNPPLLVETQSTGTNTAWSFFQELLPLTSLHIANGRILARLFNPTASPIPFSRAYEQTDVFGQPLTEISAIPPKTVLTLSLGEPDAPLGEAASSYTRLLNPPAWRVGPNRGLPYPAVIQQLREKITQLEQQLEEVTIKLYQAQDREHYLLQHQVYVLQREILEYRLSVRLNEIKLAMHGQLTHAYLFEPDQEIEAIGRELNELRIKRRIYDYVIQAV